MQHKNLQSLFDKVTMPSAAGQEAELLTQELAFQLKSGTSQPSEYPLASRPSSGLWRTLAPWLHRVERVMGRAGQPEADYLPGDE
jgi:hypothetical protein